MKIHKCFFLCVCLSMVAVQAAEKPLNILLLYADDWRHDSLGVAGNPIVQTPRIDRLAGQGMRFTQNCVTTAICGVSRACLFTGQWMSRHGCRAFGPWNTPWEETLPGLLRESGYYLGHVGKWHNGDLKPGVSPAKEYDFFRNYYGYHWFDDGAGGEIHVTQRNEKDAMEFLKTRPKDQPFCLTVAFFAPHAEDAHPDQFRPQPQSMELYKDRPVPVPVNATDESWRRLPHFFDEENEGRNRWHWRFDTPEKYQTMMKNYYRLATEVDSTCGRLLDELEKQGVLDNTLVIFTTDNGYYHAEHGLADKWYPHQESIRVPLIIRDPRMAKTKHGTTNDDFTLSVDLAPTLLAAAGIEAPETMQGEDIAPLYLASEKPEWRDEFFYEHPVILNNEFIPPSEALVRKDWKYIWWPAHQLEQLFDLQADPREENDLAGDPAHAEQLTEMRQRFRELKDEAGPDLSKEGSGGVRTHAGLPTLYIDGKPHNGLTFASYDQVPKEYKEFSDVGVNLFSFVISPTGCAYHNIQRKPETFDLWIAPDQFDFANFDERVQRVLSANPDAKIFPRLSFCAPLWWLKENRDQLGRGTNKDGQEIILNDGGRQAPSWASEKWRKDTLNAIRRLLKHVEASDYAEHIIGWHLVSGTTEEWMVWGSNADLYGDTSKPSLLKFRAWLKKKYRNAPALQQAWNKADVTFETVQFPSRERRSSTTMGTLRDPAKEQDVIDFYLYLSDLVVETIDLLCGEIRKQTRGEKLIGVFYGYILQFDGGSRLQNAGHLALTKLLQSPNIDFISAPSSYKFREFGGLGTPHYMAPHGSVKLHGKLWFNENDLRNSITPREKRFTEEKYRRWGSGTDVEGDMVQQEKELAHSMTTGAAQWWFDVNDLNHSNPTLLARYTEFGKQADEVLTKNRASVDEVAFVVDDKSSVYMAVADPLSADLVTRTFPALHRIGAPVGHYLLNDLAALKRHKMLILSNTFAPSDTDRAALETMKSGQRLILFNYASGLYQNGQLDLKAMEEFTGIKMKMAETPVELTVELGNGRNVPKELRGTQYGFGRYVEPVFIPDDRKAKVLGRLPDGSPGLVMKKFRDWTAVYSVAPVNNRDLLRWLADEAGVHFYIDTPDLVWANEEMVSVCVDQPGRRTIRLPQTCAVKDLYAEESVAKGAKTFSAEFDGKSTKVFLLTPEDPKTPSVAGVSFER